MPHEIADGGAPEDMQTAAAPPPLEAPAPVEACCVAEAAPSVPLARRLAGLTLAQACRICGKALSLILTGRPIPASAPAAGPFLGVLAFEVIAPPAALACAPAPWFAGTVWLLITLGLARLWQGCRDLRRHNPKIDDGLIMLCLFGGLLGAASLGISSGVAYSSYGNLRTHGLVTQYSQETIGGRPFTVTLEDGVLNSHSVQMVFDADGTAHDQMTGMIRMKWRFADAQTICFGGVSQCLALDPQSGILTDSAGADTGRVSGFAHPSGAVMSGREIMRAAILTK